jgi:hypothetical protein
MATNNPVRLGIGKESVTSKPSRSSGVSHAVRPV